MLSRNRTIVSTLLTSLALAGCSNTADTESMNGESGLGLTVDILDDTDVAGMHYTITPVDCGTGDAIADAEQIEIAKDLENMLIPGGNPDLQNKPFDADSKHLFADAFITVPEGCYDVDVTPVDVDGNPSEDCIGASQDAVPVFDGETTEIMLLSQCANDPVGALDVIAAVNHAPQLLDAYYEPSKFTCDLTAQLCATASDPDSDPLEFEWTPNDSNATVVDVVTEINEDGSSTSCAQIELAEPGDYNVEVVIYDMAFNEDGDLVRIEDLAPSLGSDADSHDSLNMPIHAQDEDACINHCECPDGLDVNATGDGCEALTSSDATYNGSSLDVCTALPNANYGALGALFPGGTSLVGDAFFGSGYTEANNSRLHNAGIWACDAAGNPTDQPEDEWIGFSRCLDIEAGGAYVVGIGADNFIRTDLNGANILTINSSNESLAFHPFRHWHMIPVTMTSGSNIIEMEAINVGGPGSFGAEIYGPFDPADLQDDASLMALDYANNIVWSSAEEVGGTFDLGTSGGWSCEGEAALNLCDGAPTCTLYEQAACE